MTVTAVLLSVHVLAAIVLIGPITAAASLFPRYARAALTERSAAAGGVVRALHRISAGYCVPALAVPVFGIATGARLGVLGQAWLVLAMALTAVAAVVLVAAILPAQRAVLASLDGAGAGAGAGGPAAGLPRLAMLTGLFALTWAVVVVLMIVRPGSTTGV